MRRVSGCFGHSAGHKADVPYPHRSSPSVSFALLSSLVLDHLHLRVGGADVPPGTGIPRPHSRRTAPCPPPAGDKAEEPTYAQSQETYNPSAPSACAGLHLSHLLPLETLLGSIHVGRFLRVGEYTSRTRSKVSPSTLRRILQTTTITIHLPQSKTSQYCSPPPILVRHRHLPGRSDATVSGT